MADTHEITLELLDPVFSVCKVHTYTGIDISAPYVFTGSTDEEKSLVCPVQMVPENTLARDDGWKGFRIAGILDFSLIGILAGIADVLKQNSISIFALSTYNTDYILVKEEYFTHAVTALKEHGYAVKGVTQ